MDISKSLRLSRSDLLNIYHSHKSVCCNCGTVLIDNTGCGLGTVFVLDKEGNFYCTECDKGFDDHDERIFEPDLS